MGHRGKEAPADDFELIDRSFSGRSLSLTTKDQAATPDEERTFFTPEEFGLLQAFFADSRQMMVLDRETNLLLSVRSASESGLYLNLHFNGAIDSNDDDPFIIIPSDGIPKIKRNAAGKFKLSETQIVARIIEGLSLKPKLLPHGHQVELLSEPVETQFPPETPQLVKFMRNMFIQFDALADVYYKQAQQSPGKTMISYGYRASHHHPVFSYVLVYRPYESLKLVITDTHTSNTKFEMFNKNGQLEFVPPQNMAAIEKEVTVILNSFRNSNVFRDKRFNEIDDNDTEVDRQFWPERTATLAAGEVATFTREEFFKLRRGFWWRRHFALSNDFNSFMVSFKRPLYTRNYNQVELYEPDFDTDMKLSIFEGPKKLKKILDLTVNASGAIRVSEPFPPEAQAIVDLFVTLVKTDMNQNQRAYHFPKNSLGVFS